MKPPFEKPSSGWCIEVIDPSGHCWTQTLTDEGTLGRGSDCSVRFSSWRVARRHARLRVTPVGPLIEDLGALGGTWVNGRRIALHGPLSITDTISIGPYQIRLLPTSIMPTASALDEADGEESRRTQAQCSTLPTKSACSVNAKSVCTASLSVDSSSTLYRENRVSSPNPNGLFDVAAGQLATKEEQAPELVFFTAKPGELSTHPASATAQPLAATPESTLSTSHPLNSHPINSHPLKLVTPDRLLFEWQRLFHRRLLETLDLRRQDVSRMSDAMLRQQADCVLRELLDEAQASNELPEALDRDALHQAVLDEAVGLGPLEALLNDETVSEIMVNGHDQIYVERAGCLVPHPVAFSSDQAVLSVIERIVAPIGRRIDESAPMVDARLADGSRVNAIIAPLALKGPVLTIRKFPSRRLHLDDLVNRGALSVGMGDFLQTCIEQRRNVLVCGGTGSGKTTLLNILSNFIPSDERIITIEDAAELRLFHAHWVALEARPANAEGRGAVTIRDLVRNALRMRPDRIVIGECRGAEALDMLQAMNTGHEGALTTLHANSPRDALARLETMVLMAGLDLPLLAIREQIASAIDIIVQQQRAACGTRRITAIVELTGMEGQRFQLQELFHYERQDSARPGQGGRYVASGVAPTFYDVFDAQGLRLDRSCFHTNH